MAVSYLKGANAPIHLWTDVKSVESSALDQLRNIGNLPWVYKHVAVMPDVHYGKGATVGSVIAMKDAVSPSAVGVDIGCGMAAVRTSLMVDNLSDDLLPLRLDIESAIPVGFNQHGEASKAADAWEGWGEFKNLHPDIQDRFGKAQAQLGTLGGGNHFIELCIDDDGSVWLMLHSGSRNIGKELAERHIKIAKTLEHNAHLPDPDLAVFLSGTDEMNAYRHDLMWAQAYAAQNRMIMLDTYKNILRKYYPQVRFDKAINAHHNYVNEENHYGEDVLVTRKGAISARLGEKGIIPGSMGTGSYIVSGLGNPESYHSASHGAGRVMSRGQAKRTFTQEDFIAQTAGVESRKDAGLIDEIPAAYKDINEVINYQKDLVSVEAHLIAVLCVKG